jgi:hypothetical protein
MTQEQPARAKITVEYQSNNRHGRLGKVYHIFDLDNREIALHQKEAVKLAKNILKIAKEGGKIK